MASNRSDITLNEWRQKNAKKIYSWFSRAQQILLLGHPEDCIEITMIEYDLPMLQEGQKRTASKGNASNQQTPSYALQECPLFQARQGTTWPEGEDLNQKLWGPKEDLVKTAHLMTIRGLRTWGHGRPRKTKWRQPTSWPSEGRGHEAMVGQGRPSEDGPLHDHQMAEDMNLW
jgi:hypothetical protein